MNEELEATAAAALASRLVVGLAGPEPTTAEWAWLARYRPAGVILFGRNVTGPAQAQSLCARLRALVPGLEVMEPRRRPGGADGRRRRSPACRLGPRRAR